MRQSGSVLHDVLVDVVVEPFDPAVHFFRPLMQGGVPLEYGFTLVKVFVLQFGHLAHGTEDLLLVAIQ